MPRIELGSVAYHATALPLSYKGIEPKGGYDPPSQRYECWVLPIELLRLEPTSGLGPDYRGYRPRASPPMLGRHCAGVLPLDDTARWAARGFEPRFPAAWSGRGESNPVVETGDLVPSQ